TESGAGCGCAGPTRTAPPTSGSSASNAACTRCGSAISTWTTCARSTSPTPSDHLRGPAPSPTRLDQEVCCTRTGASCNTPLDHRTRGINAWRSPAEAGEFFVHYGWIELAEDGLRRLQGPARHQRYGLPPRADRVVPGQDRVPRTTVQIGHFADLGHGRVDAGPAEQLMDLLR